MIQIKKLGFVKIVMLLLVLCALPACSMQQEENSTEIEETGEGIIDSENESTETNLDFISVEKIEKYEGMEITDWIDEQTVVLIKENQEFGKIDLPELENGESEELYPTSIYEYNLGSKEFKTIIAKKNMYLGGAILSPDNKHLLYTRFTVGDEAYYVMNLEDREQSSETDYYLNAYSAEWTDEQNLIGGSYAGGAYMADTRGNLTQIVELQEEQLYAVHKTQGKIYYITTDGQLYMLDLITKEKKNLQLKNVSDIRLSPDGKQILVTQVTESKKSLIIADVDGTIQKTIAEGSDVTGATWSPNQQMIAYQLNSVINGVDSSGMYLYEVSTGESIQITRNVASAVIRWSPSGEKISINEFDETNSSSIIYIRFFNTKVNKTRL